MTRRFLCLDLHLPTRSSAAPPGVDPAALAEAMASDVYVVLADLDAVELAVAHPPEWAQPAAAMAWRGTHLLAVPHARDVPGAVAALGADEVVLVAADAPDLPPLVIAAALRTLGAGDTVLARATGSDAAVLLGLRLPVGGPLAGLDGPFPDDAVPSTPWPRVRRPADLDRLDPGLEGWEATRALLASAPRPAGRWVRSDGARD